VARAFAAITAVEEALGDEPLPDRSNLSPLAAGEAGVALFFDYLDQVHPDRGFRERACQRIENAVDAMATTHLLPSLYAGFTGVAWVSNHLYGRWEQADASQDSSSDGEDPNSDIDDALLAHLRRAPRQLHFDLTNGLVGYAVYALDRLPRASAVACLELIVEHLQTIAQTRPEGLAWHTSLDLLPVPNRPHYPHGVDYLGIAHGTPGVIAVLSRICAAGVATGRVQTLLSGAVRWLLAQKLPPGGASVFPYSVGAGFRVHPARAAWCYGDPGIAVALLAASRAAGEPAWEREALELAHSVAGRAVEHCGVQDAGLCHGATGLGHLLNRLYQATGEAHLLTAARSWFHRALDYWQPGSGIGGFRAFSATDDDYDHLYWQDVPGFLTGSAGMAMALLAATSNVDPIWDRVLLASPLQPSPRGSALSAS
jgi:lantibiotic modifying enzyme